MGAGRGDDGDGRAAGLRMPAEWAPHERTLMRGRRARRCGASDDRAGARPTTRQVVDAIAAFEPVTLVVAPGAASTTRARRVPRSASRCVALPIDDSWLRDSGPIYRHRRRRAAAPASTSASTPGARSSRPTTSDAAIARRLLEHLGIERFDARRLVLEGGSIAVDGDGHARHDRAVPAATRTATRCWSARRSRSELRVHLGAEQVVWLGRGLVEDADTDGHVDNVCAFLAPRPRAAPDGRRRRRPELAARRGERAAPARRRPRGRALELLPRTDARRTAASSRSPTRTSTSATAPRSCRSASRTPTWTRGAAAARRAAARAARSSACPGAALALGGGGSALHHAAGPLRRELIAAAASSVAALEATFLASWPVGASSRRAVAQRGPRAVERASSRAASRARRRRARRRLAALARARRGRARRGRRVMWTRWPPAVERVAAALDVSGRLQLVEQQHEVVGVDAQRLAERLLRARRRGRRGTTAPRTSAGACRAAPRRCAR